MAYLIDVEFLEQVKKLAAYVIAHPDMPDGFDDPNYEIMDGATELLKELDKQLLSKQNIPA